MSVAMTRRRRPDGVVSAGARRYGGARSPTPAREPRGTKAGRMTRKQRRMTLIASGVGVLAVAAALVLYALRGSIVFFNSPTDLVEKRVAPGTHVRLGGMVVAGSVVHDGNLMVRFAVSDGHNTVA